LIIGGTTFLLAAVGSIPMAALFNIQPFTYKQLLSWAPWILLFVFANATQEELLFRGLFLQKLEPLYGKFLSCFLIAFVFSFLHIGVTYTADQRIFLFITFALALLWGYITQKTKGIWGSILFHAGMDIPVILGIFSNLH
jgi:membrane protease YdiL (CAAX protease family)